MTRSFKALPVPLFSVLIACASSAPVEKHGETTSHLENECDPEGLLGEGSGCDDGPQVCVRREGVYVCEARPITQAEPVDCSELGGECGLDTR